MGARIFPALVPITPDDPAAPTSRQAWKSLRRFVKPFLTAFGDSDPVTGGGERAFQRLARGAKDQAHTTIQGTSHFIQEDKGEELAGVVLDFMAAAGSPEAGQYSQELLRASWTGWPCIRVSRQRAWTS